MNLKSIEFNVYDKKSRIIIPSEINENLAELIGAIIGDGHITYNNSSHKYGLCLSGNSIDEYEYFTKHICNFITKIFNKKSSVRIIKNEIRVELFSKAIASFFYKVIGIPSDKHSVRIPECIMNGENKIKISFLRGFMDTDGSLTFQNKLVRYNYPMIKICSSSKGLIKDIEKILNEIGIQNYPLYDIINKGDSVRKPSVINGIFIYGRAQLKIWIGKVGFKNLKHITKYLIWKIYGACPPHTNVTFRKNFLSSTDFPKRDIYNLCKIEDDILEKLIKKDMYISELSRNSNISRSSVSRALKRLNKINFVELVFVSKIGHKFWRITKKGKKYLRRVKEYEMIWARRDIQSC